MHDNSNGGYSPGPLAAGDPLSSVINSLSGDYDGGRFQTHPGMDGIPHRSTGTRLYKNDDPPHLQPKSAGRVRCEIFVLTDETQRKRFEMISSLVYSMARQGKALINACERKFVESDASWQVYFEWVELFTYDPVGPRQHTQSDSGILRRST